MVARPVSILCVDDSALVGRALERWFHRFSDFRWLGWLPGPESVEETCTRLNPDVVLMDLDMPGEDAVAVVNRLAHRVPPVRVAMLSGHLRPKDIRRSLAAGAAGYLSKDQPAGEIAAEVMQVAEGKMVLSPDAEAALQNPSEEGA